MDILEIPLIESKEEIKQNLLTVEQYLNGNSKEAKDAMYGLICRGKNFVAYKVGNEYHFAPSRFIGYKDCNLDKHDANELKHGTRTSQRMRHVGILGPDTENPKLEALLEKQCSEAGYELRSGRHTFWDFNHDFKADIAASKAESEFPEGKEKEVRHKAHERNTAQVQKAKANYIQNNGAVCQICGFDFKKVYGDVGAEYIEAHHTIPVSEMKEGDITKVKDLAFVCANCHRMLHRRRPWLSIDELSMLIEKE